MYFQTFISKHIFKPSFQAYIPQFVRKDIIEITLNISRRVVLWVSVTSYLYLVHFRLRFSTLSKEYSFSSVFPAVEKRLLFGKVQTADLEIIFK